MPCYDSSRGASARLENAAVVRKVAGIDLRLPIPTRFLLNFGSFVDNRIDFSRKTL
jgi:hypothetical protein